MPKDIACPNPGCPYVFPAAAIAGAAALVCPECGGVFQVKAKKTATAETAPTPARRPPARSAIFAWLLAGLIVFVSIGLMMATIYRRAEPPPRPGPEPYRSIEHNYSMLLPDSPWRRDQDLAKRLGGVLAFRRDDPDAQVVLVVRQYPKYVPANAELRDDAVARLRMYPIENLQREDKSEGATLAGRSAGRLVFQGTADGTVVSGDVQFLTHQGAAYWCYRWCPTTVVDRAAGELADLADRFALLDLHPDWQPPRRTFIGTKLKYTLTAEGERWEKGPYPAENYDPAADLALVGKSQDGPADPTRHAQLLVLILPAGDGDAVVRAKAHLLDRYKETYPETTMSELPLVEAKAVANDVRLKMLGLHVKNTKERERFVLLGIVPRKDAPRVIWAECDFRYRAVWESDFRKLVGSYAAD